MKFEDYPEEDTEKVTSDQGEDEDLNQEEDEEEEEGENEHFVPTGTAYGQLSVFKEYLEYLVKMDKSIVQCTVCGKKLKGGIAQATRHVESMHFPGTFCYKCGSCDKEFGNYSSWQHHSRRKH